MTISYLIKDGEATLVSLGDRHSGRKEDNLDRQLVCTIQPSRFVKEYMETTDEKIKNMIKILGLQNGPVFFQGYWDGETVRLYDPGLRYPGNEYEQLLEAATGVNLMKDIIPYCVGGEIEGYDDAVGCYDLNGKVCMQYMINVGPGVITTYEGLDVIAKHPNQRNNSLHYGSDEGVEMAVAYHSVISTVKLHGMSCWRYLGEFFKKIFNGMPGFP